MSRRGNCYENAAMELLWSTLKTETGLDDSVPDQSSCRRIDRLRLHRDLLQPGETPQLARLPLTCGLRKPTNEKRQPSRLIPLSIFSRQAQLEPGGAREARGAARLDVLPLGAEGGEGPPARTGAGIGVFGLAPWRGAVRTGAVAGAEVCIVAVGCVGRDERRVATARRHGRARCRRAELAALVRALRS